MLNRTVLPALIIALMNKHERQFPPQYKSLEFKLPLKDLFSWKAIGPTENLGKPSRMTNKLLRGCRCPNVYEGAK